MTTGASASIREFAPAKVNLTLAVLGRRADGYHELTSLVAFSADVGDELEVAPAARWSLAVEGPTAEALNGPNIIDSAAREVEAHWPGGSAVAARLRKRLPVAAGIGGGSANAAAALRALRAHNRHREDPPDWHGLALRLGADVPVCLQGRLAMMSGLGERVEPLGFSLSLPTVLVNPGVPLPTPQVFGELHAAPYAASRAAHARAPRLRSPAEAIAFMQEGANHLELPAYRLAPPAVRARQALLAAKGCTLARLSGSGPTCFGIFETRGQAETAAALIAREEPRWWVRATTLG